MFGVARNKKLFTNDVTLLYDRVQNGYNERGEIVIEDVLDETGTEELLYALLDDLADGSESKEENNSINMETEPLTDRSFAAEAHKEAMEEKAARRELVDDKKENVTVITKGTVINGSISSDCSLDVRGTVHGNIECVGRLTISGQVKGDVSASEINLNTERLEGSITSKSSVKVGLGTVVIGNITAASAVVVGAVKGDIDIFGPVVIDSTAIIKGNINAKSIQMNNGAILEGYCSLSYASVDIENIFE